MSTATASFGQWPIPSTSSTVGGLLALGSARLSLGTGTEQIENQTGDVIAGITVNDVGDYTLTIAPAIAAAYPNPFKWIVLCTLVDFSAYLVVVEPSPVDGTITLNTYDAAGAHHAVGGAMLQVWVDPTT
jgi:hypothetical protein